MISGAVFSSYTYTQYDLSLVMRKPAFCICENKDADQLCGNRTADQRLCFRYTNCTFPLLPTSEISSPYHILWLYSPVCVGPGRSLEDRFSHDEAHFIEQFKTYETCSEIFETITIVSKRQSRSK